MRGAPLIFDDPELWGPNQQKKKPPSNLIATECASLLREREKERSVGVRTLQILHLIPIQTSFELSTKTPQRSKIVSMYSSIILFFFFCEILKNKHVKKLENFFFLR